MNRVVRTAKEVLAEMLDYAGRDAGQECCGLLGGREGLISEIFPAVNAAENPTKNYEIAPREVCSLMQAMRAGQMEFLGVYHSHPNGQNEPSPRDIDRAYYPDVAYFIISAQAKPAVRAFSIAEGRVQELEIQIE